MDAFSILDTSSNAKPSKAVQSNYMVFRNAHLHDMIMDVNEKLAQGWRIVGSAGTFIINAGASDEKVIYLQTLVKDK
jgi:hypothetical protein